MRQLFEFLGIKIKFKTTLHEDNASCIAVANNPTNHKGTRQLQTKFYFIREEIGKTINLQYISTNENVADLLTKSLQKPRLHYLLNKLNITD